MQRPHRRRFLTATAVLSAAVSLVLPMDPAAAVESNDEVAGATVMPSSPPFTISGDSSLATAAASDPVPFCSGTPLAGTLWYSWTPTVTEMVQLRLAGQGLSNPIAAFLAPNGADFAQVTCTVSGPWAWEFIAGVTYRIMVGQYGSGGGPFTLTFGTPPPPPPPPPAGNDDITDATVLEPLPPLEVTGDTSTGTADASDPVPFCSIGALAGTLWYSWTPATTGEVEVELVAFNGSIPIASFNTRDGSGNLSQAACTVGGQATFTFNGGVTYLIMVGQYTGAGVPGPFTLSLRSTAAPFVATGVIFAPTKKVAFTGTVASFTGPGGPGDYKATVKWGDGAESKATIVQTGDQAYDVVGTHTYKKAGDYVVDVKVVQKATGAKAKAKSLATVQR